MRVSKGWLVVACMILSASGVRAQEATSTPLQYYGFGTLTCAVWSADGNRILTGGSAGAFLWDPSMGRVTRIFIGHEGPVAAVAISADGTRIATGSDDWTARVWRVADGTTIRTLDQIGGEVRAVAFSPDGSKVLTASSDGVAQLWNVADGSAVATFSGHSGPVLSVAYSPQVTKVLTGSGDGTARLWNAATGVILQTFNCGSTVTCVAFTPDGNKILTGSGRTVRLWNVADGAQLWTRTWGSQIADVASLAITPDATTVAAGAADGWVVFRAADTGTTSGFLLAGSGPIASISFAPDSYAFLTAVAAPENIPKIWFTSALPVDVIYSGHTSFVLATAFSPSGTEVLTGSGDMTAKLWNTSDGALIRTFSGHSGPVNSVIFSPDGALMLTASSDHTAKLWDVTSGTAVLTLSGHTGEVMAAAFSPDGTKILTGSWDSTAKLWNVSSGAVIQTFTGHTQGIDCVAFSPDATRVLTGNFDRSAKIWNASDGSLIRTLSGHSDAIRGATFSPDGTQILTGSDDHTARLWDASNGALIRTIQAPERVFRCVFSPDGRKILTGSGDKTARLWNSENGTLIRTYFGHTDVVFPVAFSPDGRRILTGSHDSTARLWPPSGDEMTGHMSAVTAIAVAGDQASTVVTCHEDNVARLWSGADGSLRQTFHGHVARINAAALSPDGLFLLTGSNDRTAKLWDALGNYVVRNYTGHGEPVNAVAFSSDGTKYLTASDDGWALLWKTDDGSPLGSFAHGDAIYAMAISRDGSRVATGGADATARLWNAATGAQLLTFSGHTGDVLGVAFSRDATRVLTGGADGTARLWDATSGTLLQTFGATPEPVVSVAFSPDGTAVVTASDNATRIWNADNGTLLRTLQGHTDSLTGAVICDDGSRIVTGSDDGTARLWNGFATGPTGPTRTADKVILVAGGGDYPGNPIVGQTKALADRAYFTCLVRGYRHDEIVFLSAFNDWQTHDANGDGTPDVDAYASSSTLWSAIDSWSSDTARLFVYLIDHGSYNTATGDYFFRLNPNYSIKALDLDAHLDALQAQIRNEVVLVIDTCFSGGFVQQCRATTDTRRVVISSTTANDLSVYSPPVGAESFSFYFLSYAILGNTLEKAFYWTKLSFATMGNPAGQSPWMDDNGDGVSDKWDGAVASRHVLGRYPAFGLNAPTILDVASTQTVHARQSVVLWAQLDQAVAASEVWAVIIPETLSASGTDPVTNLTRVALTRSSTPGRWEKAWVPGPKHVGRSSVTYFAASQDSLNARLVATPVASALDVEGSARLVIPWHLMR